MTRQISAAIVAERLEEVETMLATGSSLFAIERTLSRQWGVTPRRVRDYVKRVRDAWLLMANAEDLDAKREQVRSMILAAARMAVGEQEPGTLLRCADSLALLDGVRAPARVETSGPNGGPIESSVRAVLLTPEIARELARELPRKALGEPDARALVEAENAEKKDE